MTAVYGACIQYTCALVIHGLASSGRGGSVCPSSCAGDKENLPVVIKSKALDSETYNLVNKMAQGCGLDLARLFEQHKRNTGFR